MTEYNPTLHTPEALETELKSIQRAERFARLVGSLGRAVIYNSFLGNPEAEYQLRDEQPLQKGSRPRDIDITVSNEGYSLEDTKPFPVDEAPFLRGPIQLTSEGNDWFLVTDRHNYSTELHPDTVEPFEGRTVYGIKAVTFPLKPLWLLLIYMVRCEDKII